MARRISTITITAEGRDQGKRFQITEMSATQAERWAVRAFLAISATGAELPDDLRESGFAGIAMMGIRALGYLSYDAAAPLLEEMFLCVKFSPDPRNPDIVRDLIETDIEEVATRLKLRSDVIDLHTGFSLAARLSQDHTKTDRAA